MNIEGIRHRVQNGPRAVPAADGQFYTDVAQAIADRADLLEELDRRPALSISDWQTIRTALDFLIEDQAEKLQHAVDKDPGYDDYEPDDIEWMRVNLKAESRLMERLNNLTP